MNSQKQSHPSRRFSLPLSRPGAHVSLAAAERIELVELLNLQLLTTLELLQQVKQVQWKLREVSFVAVQRLFHKIAWATTECAESLSSRIVDMGGYTERSMMSALYSDPVEHKAPGFAACICNIHALAEQLARQSSLAHAFIERLAASGDYASLVLIRDCSQQSRELVLLIQANLPQESSAPSPAQMAPLLRKAG